MKIKYILVLCLVLFGVDSFGHDQKVHQAITINAAESALDNSPAYAGFLNTVSSDLPLLGPKSGTNSMVQGSFEEDDTPKRDRVGGYRSYNHFYDPLTGLGLSEIPVGTVSSPIGNDSFTWASISNCPGVDYNGILGFLGKNVGTHNTWSWKNARGYEWAGLTATSQSERQTNLANMFRSVGQVMHLLEDTSQPQHVRNEQQK